MLERTLFLALSEKVTRCEANLAIEFPLRLGHLQERTFRPRSGAPPPP